MQPSSTLKKTAKGLEEVEKRTHKLAGRLRAVLFMVDGQRTVASLLDQAGGLATQLEGQLAELIAQGFVQELVVETPVPAATPPQATSAKPAAALPQTKPSLAQTAAATPVASARATATPVDAKPLGELPISAALPTLDSVGGMKEKLGRMLAQSMGMKAMFMTAQLANCHSLSEITALIDDIARQVAVASGGKTAEKWRGDARTTIGLSRM
jgi:hypothetical protein